MLRIRWHAEMLAVCRLESYATVPEWFTQSSGGPIVSMVRTAGELSLVIRADAVPADVTAERDFVACEIVGPLDFGLVGVLHRLLSPLVDARIPVLALSTHDTDWLLVRREAASRASTALGTVALIENAPPDAE